MKVTTKKSHKSYRNFKCQQNTVLQFGRYGLRILYSTRLTETQLHSFYWTLKKILKTSKQRNSVKLWDRSNLNLGLTKLSLESRMGKGKGAIYAKAQFIKVGTILFEFSNLDTPTKVKLCKTPSFAFPAKVILIERYS